MKKPERTVISVSLTISVPKGGRTGSEPAFNVENLISEVTANVQDVWSSAKVEAVNSFMSR